MINTDEKAIDEILDRGVEQVFSEKEELKKLLMSGKQIKLYCGYDPTASSLHIGNAISIKKLSEFQKLGHKVIFLVGDFTALIGDPTDKSAARPKLIKEEIEENAKYYKKQASIFLDFDGENPAEIRYNSEWNDKLSFRDLIELSSNFTVQQMLHRDMFEKRMEEEKPIYLHEFLYPLAQAYDSVVMDVDLEIGGNDQMFNMMRGRDLQKIINKREKFVLTMKLLADNDGAKMGKSEGNAIFLDEKPENIYGTVMSLGDGFIANTYELITDKPIEEIEEMRKQIEDGSVNPRDLKMQLAFDLVETFYNEQEAQKAEEAFKTQFQEKGIPENIEEIVVVEGKDILDLLVEISFASSKSEARRKINEGAVKLDDEKVADFNLPSFGNKSEKILKLGRKIIRLKVKSL
ncbi:MAG: tyrosine--tRNA ligase [Candidatus Pacebacteria bacterium]|nr:tyrosine--tRNA ligase [Candidatus Paceibacterota bacterium]